MEKKSLKCEKGKFIRFQFRANPVEFFKIWLSNLLMTVASFGLYSAWAKVNIDKYIYKSTFLNNHNFEYDADPKSILLGRTIIFGFYAIFILFYNILEIYSLAIFVVILFILIFPWLFRQSIKFKLENSYYRDVNFSYKAKVIEFYIFAIFVVLSLGAVVFLIDNLKSFINGYGRDFSALSYLFITVIMLIIPLYTASLIYKEYKRILINNTFYGNRKFNVNITLGTTFKLILKVIIISAISFLILGVIGGLFFNIVSMAIDINNSSQNGNGYQYFLITVTAVTYITVLAFIQGIIDGYFSNFIKNNIDIDGLKFKGEVDEMKLGYISATNALMVIFSLGLLYPYAKLRYLKEKIESTSIYCRDSNSLNVRKNRDNSIYDEIKEFYDIDIGI
jgi:uncharacterized membrane protein YjgN (DUF898 family)